MFENKISDKQIEANRANARKSTGPKTEEGKQRCSQNARRHGLTGQVSIMTEEDREAYNKFAKEYIADLDPEGSVQVHLAQSIAKAAWRLDRIQAIEENYFAFEFEGPIKNRTAAEHPEIHAALTQALTFFEDPKTFALLSLYEGRIHRKFNKDLKTFMELKRTRPLTRRNTLPQVAAQPKTRTAGATESTDYPENGSVCSNSDSAPAPVLAPSATSA